jgi:hypothetical protein
LKKSKLLFLKTFILFSGLIVGQETERIRFAKDHGFVYFFQAGEITDTISKEKGTSFYLLAPDSLKEFFIINVENGKFTLSTKNDSIIKLEHMPGLRYESRFLPAEESSQPLEVAPRKFRTLMNGVSVVPKNTIIIQLIDKRRNKTLAEQQLIFRPK